MMDQKQKYRELCRVELSIPVFSRDWWLDAVCGDDNWDVLTAEKDGHIVASMPYFIQKKYGFKIISQPLLTQVNGIWIKYPENQTYARKLHFEVEIMDMIIDQLSRLKIHAFNQNFHYSITNWLPFYWRGFQQTTRYTYVIEDITELDNVYMGFESRLKGSISKAKKLVEVKEDCCIELLYSNIVKTFKRQGLKVPYPLEYLKRLDNACAQKNCSKMFYAIDEKNRVHATEYLIWDENSSYCLVGGADPELRNSEATSLLEWNEIQLASKVTKRFDFTGSMLRPVERHFKSFGAVQKPYFNISKSFGAKGTMYDILKQIRSMCTKKNI